MYKCMDCGNTEKFIGFAEEKGNAYIYQDCINKSNTDCSWIYIISDSNNNWESNINIYRCFYCNSTKITEFNKK